MNKKSTPPNLLKHTDDDFRNAVQSIPIGILEIDLDNCIVFANKFALDLLQMTEKDIDSGLCLKDIVSPSQIRAVSEGLKRLKEGTEPISMGIRVRRRDGVEIPTETTARLIIEKGVPVGYTSYSTDMTRRIAIEERIRQQEGLFSFILDHSSFVGILIVDDQFKIEYVNDRVCEIIGRTRGELQGSDFRAFIAEESLQLVADRYVRRQKGEKMPPEYSISIIRADNSIRNLKVSASLMTGADKSRKTVAQVIDITDELNQKKALEESEHQYRTLLETMDSGLCVDNESGICIMANQALCDMIGYPSPTDLVGKPIIQWIQGWTITEVEAKTAARKEGTADHYEVNLTHRSGEIIPAIVHASPWFDSSGEYLGSFSVFTDVSELKRAEAESRFLLDLLLHDIGNQLQLILAGADLLDRESTGEQIDNARRYVLDGASRCIELISNVRRAEESKSEPLVITDLAYILQTQVRLFSGQFGVVPEVKGIPHELRVRADRALGHLFWNIMENSVKHNTREERKIWIDGQQESDFFTVRISDNGPGLDAKKKAQLFDPTRRSSGVGIHLVRRLASKYDARLKVLDRVPGIPGEGLEVTITFRVAE